jgi:hypothetical protein
MTDELQQMNERVEKLEIENTEFKKEIESNYTINKNLVNNTVAGIQGVLDVYLRDQGLMKLAIKGALIFSPFFVYQKTLMIHINHAFPKLKDKINPKEYKEIVKLRAKSLIIFNQMAVPIIGFYYLGLAIINTQEFYNYKPLTKPNDSDPFSSISLLSIFKKIKVNKIMLIPIIIGLGYYILPIAIKYISPELYIYLSNLISYYPYWYVYFFLIYMTIGFIKHLLEFYLIMLYSIDRKSIKISYNLPSFILNWLKEIEELSKLSLKREVFDMYIRFSIYYSIIIFIILIYLFLIH